MGKLDVLYTVDNKYIDVMLGSIVSLILNANINELRLHIITSGFSLDDYRKVEDALYKYPGVQLYFYDIRTFDIEKFGIPNWRGTQIANARLFFQEIISENVGTIDNLLYLDSDTIVVDSLEGLTEYNSKTISAVKDGCFKNYLTKMGGLSNYFNSGVLYFNVPEWTSGGFQDEIIHFLETTQLPLMYPDQDALNCALDGNICSMPLEYNLGANTYLFKKELGQRLYYSKRTNLSYDEIEAAKKNPRILHSTGLLSIKPWMNNDINPFNDEFMKYILMANPEFQKLDISRLKKILTFSPELFKMMVIAKTYLPEPIKDFARKLTL